MNMPWETIFKGFCNNLRQFTNFFNKLWRLCNESETIFTTIWDHSSQFFTIEKQFCNDFQGFRKNLRRFATVLHNWASILHWFSKDLVTTNYLPIIPDDLQQFITSHSKIKSQCSKDFETIWDDSQQFFTIE